VTAADGGCAEALILLGILLVADPDMLAIQQADDRGNDRVLADGALGEILLHLLAQLG
jgi:hypothetical protein